MKRRRRQHAVAWLLVLGIAWAMTGCAGGTSRNAAGGEYRTVAVDPNRDTDAARRANEEGVRHLDAGDVKRATEAFERALSADIEFGPAHNNLGKVYYQQRQWYRAAWEFEYARKLLPRHAEPRNNLGLVLEASGELDRAVEQYREAVTLDSAVIAYKANLVRALVRRGDKTDEVRALLDELLTSETRPDWLTWARRQRAMMDRDGQ